MGEPVVLCVDPDDDARRATVDHIRESTPFDVVACGTLADARDALAAHPVECVVTEYRLPDGTGFDLVDHVRRTAPDVGCVLYTAADVDEVPTADAPRVAEFLFKDTTSVDRLVAVVETTVTARPQVSYPLPQREGERLEALSSYDFDSESVRSALAGVTNLAALHFGVETASVNVIDKHTQTFVACHGAEWAPTSREASICTYAIADDSQVTVVPDVEADPRFRDNETLEELGIKFYAGVDLTDDDGLTVGTLCVYDDHPRTFDDDDREYLELLGEQAVRLLGLHRELDRAREDGDGDPGGEDG